MGLNLQDILGGTLLDSVKGIISEFKMSPDDKAKLQQALQQEQDTFAAAENDYNTKLNDIAGQNIRTEEAGGSYERNARPTVIWAGIGAILWNYCLVPVVGIHWHMQQLSLPDPFWWTWGTVVTGYVFARSTEKIAQMPGDSSIKLPFGLGGIQQNSPK